MKMRTMVEFTEGWKLDEHGNVFGPYGVRVFIDFKGQLHMIQTPNCGEPAPWEVVTFLRDKHVGMLRECERVQRRELAQAAAKTEPSFEVGDRIQLNCPGKAEHGSSGKVIEVCEYTGPKMYDDWEYVTDIDKGFMAPTRMIVPGRWAVPEDEDE